MLDTDPCRLLVPNKQSRFGTTRHPLLNLTRTTVSSVGICQQIEVFPDLEFPPVIPSKHLVYLLVRQWQVHHKTTFQSRLNSTQARGETDPSVQVLSIVLLSLASNAVPSTLGVMGTCPPVHPAKTMGKYVSMPSHGEEFAIRRNAT